MAFRLTGSRDLAEDLAQEVFLRVHRGLPYFRGEARLGTWIYRIVANLATEPRFRRRPETSLDAGEEGRPARELASHDASFAELELKDRLEKAMARLPENYQLLVAGHYLKGVRYEDLADAAGRPDRHREDASAPREADAAQDCWTTRHDLPRDGRSDRSARRRRRSADRRDACASGRCVSLPGGVRAGAADRTAPRRAPRAGGAAALHRGASPRTSAASAGNRSSRSTAGST